MSLRRSLDSISLAVVSALFTTSLAAAAPAGPTSPTIHVAPDSVAVQVAYGDSTARTLTIENLGSADLNFTTTTHNAVLAVYPFHRAPLASRVGASHEGSELRSDRVHGTPTPVASRHASTPGATVLLLEDVLPWGTSSNETLLTSDGIAFDVINSTALASTDLSQYQRIIVASDQPTSFYLQFMADSAHVYGFVASGGVLEFHSAGWGFASGDASLVTLPAGMHIYQRYASTNTVVDPFHPLVAGVPSPFSGSSASHASFSSIPPAAHVVVQDDLGAPNLVLYRYGSGLVIAAGQTLEYGVGAGQAAGQILANMIPYDPDLGLVWLRVSPDSGTVTPSNHADLQLTFDATHVLSGEYAGVLWVSSNDPNDTLVTVPLRMRVVGIPDVALRGIEHEVVSGQDFIGAAAQTVHALSVSGRVEGAAEIALEIVGDFGDFTEQAALTSESGLVGTVGPIGGDCLSGLHRWPVSAGDFAAWVADGVVNATVQNSNDVDAICPTNRHVVTLRYRSPADTLRFGPLFVGVCASETLEVANIGTDVLTIGSITSNTPEFTITPPILALAAGEHRDLVVTFCGAAPGEVDGTLTLTSDDPDSPTLHATLIGLAVAAPVAVFTPDSLTADLLTGASTTQTLTVENTGGSDLEVALHVVAPPESLAAAATLARRHPAALTRPGAPAYPDAAARAAAHARAVVPSPAGITRTAGALPIVLIDPTGDAAEVDVVDVRGSANDDSVFMQIDFASSVENIGLGGVVSLDIDEDPGTGTAPSYGLPGQDVGAEFEVYLPNAGAGEVALYAVWPSFQFIGSFPASLSGSALRFELPVAAIGGDGNFTFCGNVGISGPLDWFPDSGHGSLHPVSWISLSLDSLLIPAGQHVDVTATFDATGLIGGDYRAAVRAETNDPLHLVTFVPAHLHVTGAPDIAIHPAALPFGNVFVNFSRRDSVMVVNLGTDVLTGSVALQAPSAPQGGVSPFTLSPPSFSLAPAESVAIVVTFAPTAPIPASAVLEITSNDPDETTTDVALTGAGVIPPDIAVTPDSLDAGLVSGDSVTRIVTIENTGGSDLTFHIDVAGVNVPGGPRPATLPARIVSVAPHPARAQVSPALRAATGGDGWHATGAREGMKRPLDAAEGGGFRAARAFGPASARRTDAFEFQDGFEDGAADGWNLTGGSSVEVTSATAAEGQYSVHQYNALGGHFSGIWRYFGEVQPSTISFDVRTATTNLATGYFVLRDSTGADVIWFFARGTGRFYLNADVGGDESYAYTPDTWYHVEFRNVDFDAKTFDYYVNGTLVKAGVPFRNAAFIHGVAVLDLYNYDGGTQAWWDDIRLSQSPPAAWVQPTPIDSVVTPGSAVDVTVKLDATGLLGGEYGAELSVNSNDPDENPVVVPIHLHVTGVPDLLVHGSPHVVRSVQSYSIDGATTLHTLPVEFPHEGGATLGFEIEGDYGDQPEWATLYVEGDSLGQLGATGSDCAKASTTFAIDPATFATWLADGHIDASVINTLDVNPFCLTNTHTLTLSYTGPVDTLTIGPVFAGGCRSESLTVQNVGTDALHITSLASDDPAFVITPGSVSLPPGASQPVAAQFCSVTAGDFYATLTITSDDPDTPVSTVVLHGIAVPPPIMAVAPDSMSVALLTGETDTRTLTVSNSGASDLDVTIDVDAGLSAAARPTGVRATPHGQARRVWSAPERSNVASGTLSPAAARSRASRLGARHALLAGLPLVLTDPTGDGGAVDLVSVRGISRSDSLLMELECTTPIVPGNFAGGVSFDIDQDPATGFPPFYATPGQDIGAEYVVYLFNIIGGNVDLVRTSDNLYIGSYPATVTGDRVRFGVPLAAMGGDDGQMDFDGVVGTSGGPTDWFPDNGHGTIGSLSWLSLAQDSASVAPGDHRDILVTFDPGSLFGGDYFATIHVNGNDPLHPSIPVPVHLHVTGAPDLSVSPGALAFGSVFLGGAALRPLVVQNIGTDMLHVTAIASSDPQVVAVPGAFTLAPGVVESVLVTYTPSAAAPLAGQLSISSDDPGTPILDVPFTGQGLLAPVLAFAPDSITAEILAGTATTRTLTLTNTGGSELDVALSAFAFDSLPGAPSRARLLRSLALRDAARPGQRFGGRATLAELPIVLVDTLGDGGTADVTAIRALVHDDSLTMEVDAGGLIIPGAFNGTLWLDIDQNSATGIHPPSAKPGQDVGVEFEIRLFNGVNAWVDVWNVVSPQFIGSFETVFTATTVRFSIPLWAIGGDDGKLDMAGVVADLFGPTDWFPETGHAEIGDNGWLTLSHHHAALAPGEHLDVTVGLRAFDLLGGIHEGEVFLSSNDPLRQFADVPVHLHVIGVPDIRVRPTTLSFGPVVVGSTGYDSLWVVNDGTDDLHVSGIVSDDPKFTAAPTGFSVAAGESVVVSVHFAPDALPLVSATLTVTSDDPDEGTVPVSVSGSGLPAPDIQVTPLAIHETLQTSHTKDVTLTIQNAGAGTLHWSMSASTQSAATVVARMAPVPSVGGSQAKTSERITGREAHPERLVIQHSDPAPGRATPAALRAGVASPARAHAAIDLTTLVSALASNSSSVTDEIPSRYDFQEGEAGIGITDGGNDMYDGGNYLYTNLGGPLPYTNSVVTSNLYLGGADYVTVKVPGLFVLAADLAGVDNFSVNGDLGADGSGSVDGAVLGAIVEGVSYVGFVKRVFGAGDPSVNHLIIVPTQPGLSQQFSINTNSDFHEIDGLTGATRIYELVYASANGGYVDDAATLEIMKRFLELTATPWLTIGTHSGVIASGGNDDVTVSLSAVHLPPGDYVGNLSLTSDDPDSPHIDVPVTLHADSVTATTLSLVDAVADAGVARLTWQASGAAGTSASVERREGAAAWSVVGAVSADGQGMFRFEDHGVAGGHTYGYRLSIAGGAQVSAEVVLEIPAPLVFALHGPWPNPSGADLRVAFTLPAEGPATLELLDLAGRRVASRDVGALGAGRHVVALGDRQPVAGGVYLVRLTRAGQVLTTKAVVLH